MADGFINDGTVEAETDNAGNVDTDFLIVNADIIEDTADAKWVTNCQAQLKFLNNACLEGDFFDLGITGGPGGEFSFAAIVHTRGIYSRDGCGSIFLPDGGEFAVADVVDDMNCALNTTLITSTCNGVGQIGKVPAVGLTTLCVGQ